MKRAFRRLAHWLFCRPGIQRSAVSEFTALEREVLDDGPFEWPEHDVIDPQYCGCRQCHDHGIGALTDAAIETAFQGMLDVPDTRQFAERTKRTRGRKWTP